VQFLSAPSVGLTVLKQASADRIKELLGVLNYLASPFGSQENLLVGFGVKDVDYQLDANGNPKPTQKGTAEALPWPGLVRRPPVLYDATNPQAAKVGYDDESKIVPLGQYSPTVGLYSNTYAQKGATLNRAFSDGVNQILFGREPVSGLDDLVKAWRSGGGDQIRSEFEQALQDASK
jgi:putative aldouronate transport system substrate-binding protein